MGKYEWIEMTDIKEVSNTLIDKYPAQFNGILSERLKFVGIMDDKPLKEGAKIWSLISIPDPANELFGIDMVVVVHFDSWSNLSDKARALVVASILSCIEWKDRLVSKGYDLHDSKNMILNFGVDYENNPESPDILSTHYHWR